jgi:hypothetical protein
MPQNRTRSRARSRRGGSRRARRRAARSGRGDGHLRSMCTRRGVFADNRGGMSIGRDALAARLLRRPSSWAPAPTASRPALDPRRAEVRARTRGAPTIGGGYAHGGATPPASATTCAPPSFPLAWDRRSSRRSRLTGPRGGMDPAAPRRERHPLDDGTAGVLARSLDRDGGALGPDGAAWRRLFGRWWRAGTRSRPLLGASVLRVPRHSAAAMAGFGMRALWPAATLAARRCSGRRRRAASSRGLAAQRDPAPRGSADRGLRARARVVRPTPWAGRCRGAGSQAVGGRLAALVRAQGGEIVDGARPSRALGRLAAPAPRRYFRRHAAAARSPSRGDACPAAYRRRLGALPLRAGRVQDRRPLSRDRSRGGRTSACRAGTVHLGGS